MNEFERLSRMANQIKAKYPEGTRILLIQMGDDDPRPIPPNTRGTVDFVDDLLNCIPTDNTAILRSFNLDRQHAPCNRNYDGSIGSAENCREIWS